MKGVIVAFSSITWPRGTPREQILREIAEAGFQGVPAGYQPGIPASEVKAQYQRYGLKPGPGYLGGNFWDLSQREMLLEQARRQAAFMAELGNTELFVADNGFGSVTPRGKTRRELAAHVTPEDGLTDDQYKIMGEVLSEVGRITLREGVRVCFHNHVGSYIETRQEIDKLFSVVDRSVVFQGPDIGHLAWAGADPVAFCRDYRDAILSLHLKDIYPDVLKEGQAKGWGYQEYSDHGIFAELGEGMVDFPAIFQVLSDYRGWVIVEIDRTTKASPAESARICRRYLESIGL